MASPNTIQFTDLKVTLVTPPGVPQLSEQAIADNAKFQVVAEVEAGDAIFNTLTPPFNIQAVVTDKATGTIITRNISGTVGNAPWDVQSASIALPSIPAQGAASDNHLYEVSAVLSVGAKNPEVEFAPEDVRFIVVKPL